MLERLKSSYTEVEAFKAQELAEIDELEKRLLHEVKSDMAKHRQNVINSVVKA